MSIDFSNLKSKLQNYKPNVPLLSNSEPVHFDRPKNQPLHQLAPSLSVENFDEQRANEEQTTLLRL
jgi:hypothetical protein